MLQNFSLSRNLSSILSLDLIHCSYPFLLQYPNFDTQDVDPAARWCSARLDGGTTIYPDGSVTQGEVRFPRRWWFQRLVCGGFVGLVAFKEFCGSVLPPLFIVLAWFHFGHVQIRSRASLPSWSDLLLCLLLLLLMSLCFLIIYFGLRILLATIWRYIDWCIVLVH